MSKYKEIILALTTGIVAGFVFGQLNLPIPAPPAIDGFMGIFGVWLGSFLINKIFRENKEE